MIKNGIVNDDRKFFEDFQINKGGISLRTMQSNNDSLGERWDNILKRNVLGEYSRDNKINKRNRKLKQMHIIDLKNRDDIFLEDEDKLKIIE
ncbi:MAG: hypothetical protein MJ252_10315 [archaeon]|nr:hypothetical protein [archaeon]